MHKDQPQSIVDYIADMAEGRSLQQAAFPDAANRSADYYAKMFCGRNLSSGYSPYKAAFLRANNKLPTYRVDLPMGVDAYSLVWPACLFVSDAPGEHDVHKGDRAAVLYTELTGSAGGPDTRQKYFNRADLDRLTVGDKLQYQWTTAATKLKPKSGQDGMVDTQDFIDGLRDMLGKLDDVAQAYVRIGDELLRTRKDDALPRVVLAAEELVDDEPIGPPAACRGQAADITPWAARVRRDFNSPNALALVDVLVIDNGFFGAVNDSHDGTVRLSPKFDGYFKLMNGQPHLGPPIQTPDLIYPPLIDPSTIPPTAISGHGTHVAGLVLGGKAFEDDRSFLLTGGKPWLRLSVANVGNGGLYLPADPGFALDTPIMDERPSIVSLSLVFTKFYKGRFRAMANLLPEVLFVSAAGNDGWDVSNRDIYPAALGGRFSKNFLTVAASLPDGSLASFSNTGFDAVDIAAPGCELESWIDFAGTSRKLSGTSQATPLVSLTAALIRALAGPNATPGRIKSRILASGDLLQTSGDYWSVPIYSKSTLNMAKALYLAKDYIRFREANGNVVEALGTLTSPSGDGCRGLQLGRLSAFKQRDKLRVGFEKNDSIDVPCEAITKPDDRVLFEIEALVKPDGVIEAHKEPRRKIFMKQVEEFVLRMM